MKLHILTLSLVALFTCHLVAHDTGMTAKSFVSWTSSKLEPRPTASGTCGMFAKDHINKDELVATFGGLIIKQQQEQEASEDIWNINGSDTLEPIDYINHSCKPNAGIHNPGFATALTGGQILLVAMRDIRPNEEVTFDYGMVGCLRVCWHGTDKL